MPRGYTTSRLTPVFPLNFTASRSGTVPPSGGGVVDFTRADGSWAVPAGTGLTTIGMVVPTGLNVSPASLSSNGTFTITWTGTIPNAQLPNPGASALGGVESATAPSNEFMTGINTSGVPQFAQPSFSNISGVATAAQLPTWSSWSPSFSSTSGTLGTTTTNEARYVQYGKMVQFYIDVSITSAGTSPTGALDFTLPTTPINVLNCGAIGGCEQTNSSVIGGAVVGTGPFGRVFAGTGGSPNIMLNNNRIVIFGTYETS